MLHRRNFISHSAVTSTSLIHFPVYAKRKSADKNKWQNSEALMYEM